MSSEQTDEIAREAARMIVAGEADDIGRAIRAAAARLGLEHVVMPRPGLVRAHAEGVAMEAVGLEGHRDLVHGVWTRAEEIMTLLEAQLADTTTLLVGRAARGQIDAGVTAHIRAYTSERIGAIAATLVEAGYEEPRFETAETRLGRLDRIRFDDDGLGVVVTRCPPGAERGGAKGREQDLFGGKPIATRSLDGVRRELEDAGN